MKAHKLDIIEAQADEFTMNGVSITKYQPFWRKNIVINGNMDV